MQVLHNYWGKLFLFLLLNLVVIDAFSISISARRLYLDPQNNSTDIRVLNMEGQTQSCEVEIGDIEINSQGLIALVSNGNSPMNSAKPLLRLAPKRFTISPGQHQTVKLLYRRKPGIENGEFRGVLAIKCKDKPKTNEAETNNEIVKIQPALVHNVPVIVRTGRLPFEAQFTQARISDGQVEIEVTISGQRSITGDITLLNSNTGEVLFEEKDLSIYEQQPVKALTINIKDVSNAPLLVKFTENTNFGGDLVIQRMLK